MVGSSPEPCVVSKATVGGFHRNRDNAAHETRTSESKVSSLTGFFLGGSLLRAESQAFSGKTASHRKITNTCLWRI